MLEILSTLFKKPAKLRVLVFGSLLSDFAFFFLCFGCARFMIIMSVRFFFILSAKFFQQLCMRGLLVLAQIYWLWGPARVVSYIQTKMDSIRMEWGASGVCPRTPTWNLYSSDSTPKAVTILFPCTMAALPLLLWLVSIAEYLSLQTWEVHPTTFSWNLLVMGPL